MSRIYSKIIATGSHLPPRRVTNAELAIELARSGIETSDEWIRSRSGIAARHYAEPDVAASDLAVSAARCALEAAHLSPDHLDLIVVATSTPDMVFPSTACIVQRKLGIDNGCAAFDVQAVCSGFIYAMAVADNAIQAGQAKRALVIGSEVFSRILDFKDRTTCVLFGDGAGRSCSRRRARQACSRRRCTPTGATWTSCACRVTCAAAPSQAAPFCT